MSNNIFNYFYMVKIYDNFKKYIIDSSVQL